MSVPSGRAARLGTDRHGAAPSALNVRRPTRQARYERILQATITLAQEGSDAVQMRAVAEKSGVALGTVYTYFQSRDNLLHSAVGAWNSTVAEKAAAAFDGERSRGVEQLESEIITAVDFFLEQPGLLDAFVKSTLSSDPAVVEARKRVIWDWSRASPSLALLGDENARLATDLLTHTFYAGTVRWSFGQVELSEVREQIRRVLGTLVRASSEQ